MDYPESKLINNLALLSLMMFEFHITDMLLLLYLIVLWLMQDGVVLMDTLDYRHNYSGVIHELFIIILDIGRGL